MRYAALIALLLAFTASAQINPWDNRQGATVPAYSIKAVILSDQYEFSLPMRALWIGVGGNLAVVTWAGERVTIVGVQDGTLLPLTVKQVLSTGTTASSVQAWY